MHVTVDCKAMSEAMAAPGAAIRGKHHIELLNYLRLEAGDGQLSVTGADGEIMVTVSVPAEVRIAGALMVHPGRMAAILRECNGPTCEIEGHDSSVTVRAGGVFSLESPSAEDYPAFQKLDATVETTVASDDLAVAINRTMFCCDTESTRYALGGVLFDLGDSPCLVSTDSRRLAVAPCEAAATGTTTSPIIPQKALVALSKGMDGEPVTLRFNENNVIASTGSFLLQSRLVEGRFPRYQDVIPSRSDSEAILPVASLVSALKQAQVVTSEESRGVDFRFTEDGICVESSGNSGSASILVDCSVQGESFTIDPRFLVEMLARLPKDASVKMSWTDGGSAILFSLDDYRYVIMPLARDH